MMPVTSDDVERVADLARLELSPEDTRDLVAELNGILRHMEDLAAVDTAGLDAVAGVGAQGLPLRSDSGPPAPLERSLDAFTPEFRDGFILVPRLRTHRQPGQE